MMSTYPHHPSNSLHHSPSPAQLKGDLIGLNFAVDTADHRKRRRNRTTQSCLSCHTSKRKCDRKRPCHRCIQLGLTGLCIYETDDPASRDDPNLDENARLQRRIAELERLVRELRGKPHPRWADSTFRNGHSSDKWHSRASKPSSSKQRRASLSSPEAGPHPVLSGPIKGEDMTLYRISPSPDESISVRFTNGYPSNSPAFENGAGAAIAHGHKSTYSTESTGSSLSYNAPSSAPTVSYIHSHDPHSPQHHHEHSASFSEGCYPLDHQPTQDDDSSYFTTDEGSSVGTAAAYECACRTSPAVAHALAALSAPLQNAIAGLRQYPGSNGDGSAGHDCRVFRKVLQLHHLLQCASPNPSSSTAHSHALALSFSANGGGGSESGCESVGAASNVSAAAAAAASTVSNGVNHTAAVPNGRHPAPTLDPFTRPTASEIMASLSASNSPYHGPPAPQTTSSGPSPHHEWNPSGLVYGSYFPQPTEHPGYSMS